MASTSLTLSMLPARRLPSGSGQVWLTSGAASAHSSSLAKPTQMASLSACLKLSPCWVRCRSSRMAKSSSRVTVVLMASNHNVLDDLMTTSHLASLIGLERRVPRMEHAGPESFGGPVTDTCCASRPGERPDSPRPTCVSSATAAFTRAGDAAGEHSGRCAFGVLGHPAVAVRSWRTLSLAIMSCLHAARTMNVTTMRALCRSGRRRPGSYSIAVDLRSVEQPDTARQLMSQKQTHQPGDHTQQKARSNRTQVLGFASARTFECVGMTEATPGSAAARPARPHPGPL